jgi:hypothetical protein
MSARGGANAAEGNAKTTLRTAYQVVRLVQDVFAIAGRCFRRCILRHGGM